MDDHTGQRHRLLCAVKGIGPSGWRIASILPYRDVFRLSHELSIEMLVIVIAVALAAYLLAYLTSQSTLKRISQLTGTMQAVEKATSPCGWSRRATMRLLR